MTPGNGRCRPSPVSRAGVTPYAGMRDNALPAPGAAKTSWEGICMRSFVAMLLGVSVALAVAEQASAQAPAQAPAAVPDQMPFDIPYGTPITADRAAKVVAVAVEEANKSPRNWKLA